MCKFFNYYNSMCVGANSPSVFSSDPYIIAVKQLFITELRQIVFYIQKLKDLSINISSYRDKVIEFIAILLYNYDFKKESFFFILDDLYKNKDDLHSLYVNTCNELNLEIELLESQTPILKEENDILKILNDYELDNSIFNVKLSQNKKNLYDIIVNLILNACNTLIELKNYGINYSEAKDKVLSFFNVSNFLKVDESILINKINDFAEYNFLIMNELNQVISLKFGNIERSDVKNLQKVGSSILVSGYSFLELQKILELTKDLDINIYTHDNMINAFKYSMFKKYKNLIGHYQPTENNFLYDFSSFPGPVFISKNFIPKFDCIRGQLFTSSKYPANGVAKVENNDFSSFIECALSSSGFIQDKTFSSLVVGYDEEFFKQKVDEIYLKLVNKEIKHIIILGLSDSDEYLHSYMQTLIDLLPNDCYIVSFSIFSERDNFFFIEQPFDFSTIYFLLNLFYTYSLNIQSKIKLFLPNCSSDILSHIFNFLYFGVGKIFIGPCCPTILNPSLVATLSKYFSVKQITSPSVDIDCLLH